MKKNKIIAGIVSSFLLLTLVSCTTVRYYPVNFVESLKHPTKFPDVFNFTVQNIEEVAQQNPLREEEDIKVTDVSENKNSSMHLIQVRENEEYHPHYHKRHDEIIFVKKGSGIAILDGARYMVKPGSVLQIPSKTVHKVINTGNEVFVAISIFSPPYDGRDEKQIKDKSNAERVKKEKRRLADKKPHQEAGESASEEKTTTAAVEPDEHFEKKGEERIYEKPAELASHRTYKTDNEQKQKTTNESLFSENVSQPASGKKSRKRTYNDNSTMDIMVLHEKLSKLLALKDEGSISPEEYERMKDALVSGNDVGVLPEPKTSEPQSFSALDDEEEDIPQDLYYTPSDSQKSYKKDEVTYQYEPPTYTSQGLTSSSTDHKFKILEEMRREGLINEEDYEQKKRELLTANGVSKSDDRSENMVTEDRLNDLQELYEDGLVSEDDYRIKYKELTKSQAQDKNQHDTIDKELGSEKLARLRELLEQGLITEEDYEYKYREFAGTQSQHGDHTGTGDTLSNKFESDKLDQLNELLEQGLISKEDYNFKYAELADSQTQNIHPEDNSQKVPENEKLVELKDLLAQGLITDEDYYVKYAELTETQPKDVHPEDNSQKVPENEKLAELKDLLEKGFITEEDYKYKSEELTGIKKQDIYPKNNPINEQQQEKLKKIEELMEEGFITEEEYKRELEELKNIQSQNVSPVKGDLSNEFENEKLSELRELMEQGVITKEDYEFKKNAIAK